MTDLNKIINKDINLTPRQKIHTNSISSTNYNTKIESCRPTTSHSPSHFFTIHRSSIEIPQSRIQLNNIYETPRTNYKKPFVLDGCKVTEQFLPNYNGLSDRYLIGYFSRPKLRKHLISMKIVLSL